MVAKLMRRRSVRVLLILAALLALAVVLVPRLIPAERLRDLAVTRLEQATGAEVSLGEARVSLLPRLRIVIGDGRATGSGEALRRASGVESNLESYDVALDRLEVDVALWPLLRRRLETGAVRLVAPRIEVATRAAAAEAAGGGEARRATAPGAEGAESAAGGPAPPAVPWELAVAGLEIEDGQLSWREAGSEKQVEVTGWQQDVALQDLDGLLERLAAFQPGTAAPAREGGATGTPRLDLRTRLAELSLRGFGADPLALRDLELTGVLTAPPDAPGLGIRVESLAWRHVELAAELALDPADGAARLQGSCSLTPAAAGDLLADLLELAPAPPPEVAAWLAERPVRDGRLELAGSLDLPWPLPPDATPAQLLAGISLDGRLAAGRLALPEQRGELGLAAELGLLAGVVSVRELELGLGEDAARVTGSLSLPLPGVTGPLRSELRGSGDLSALQSLAEAFAPPPAEGTAPAPRIGGRLEFTLTADVADPPELAAGDVWRERLESGVLKGVRLEGAASSVVLEGELPGAPWSLGRIGFSSDLAGADLSLTGLDHAVVAGDATAAVTRFFPGPAVVLDLRVRRLDVDGLVAILTPAEQTAGLRRPSLPDRLLEAIVGTAWAAAPATAPATPPGERIPADLRVSYTGHAEQVLLQKARYDAVDLKGQLAQRVLEINEVTGRRAEGTVRAQGRIDYVKDPYGLLAFTAEAADVPAAALLEPYAPGVAPLWEGSVSATGAGKCSLKDKDAVLGSLSLDGDALSTSGRIVADRLLEDISPYLGQRQDLKNIKFREFMHHFAVRDGRYHMENLKLHGPDTDWIGDGWLGFDGGIDMGLQVKLPPGFQPDLGNMSFLAETLRGEDGRIMLSLRLTGRARKPKVQLDLTAAKAKAEEQMGEKVEDAVKKGVKGLLDNIKRR